MPDLLKRIKLKQKAPPISPAKLERLRRAKWGNDLYERLCGKGNAYDGAQYIVAKGKAEGTYSPDIDPDDKQALKAERAARRFKLNRKSTKKLVTKLAKRVNGSTDVEAERPRIKRNSTGGEGYKGHRPGCMKEKAHKLFDELAGKPKEKVVSAMIKAGIKATTAGSWYSSFRRSA